MQRYRGLISLVLGLACCSAYASEAGKTHYFTILHTNDLHGSFWPDSNGEAGLAVQKTLINSIRTEVARKGGYTLVLNAGDVNTGEPESDLQDALPMFKAMNAIGYDAMTLGNHEFDKPQQILFKQKSWANFPMLSANLRDSSGKRPFPAVAGFLMGGLKVAVMGLTTPETTKWADPVNLSGVTFDDSEAVAKRLVPVLRKQANVVIALTHLGYYPDGKHAANAPGDVTLARDVPGIDIIVGGHTHTVLCMTANNQLETDHVPGAACRPDQQNGSWIMQAGDKGRYVGRADFAYRQGKLSLLHYAMIPVNLKHDVLSASGQHRLVLYDKPIAQDPALAHTLAAYENDGRQGLEQVIGQSQALLDGQASLLRTAPASLGIFVASALKTGSGADLAVINAGGMGGSLPQGPISSRDVLKVLPYGSTVVTVDLTGSQLFKWLSKLDAIVPGCGAYPQFAGVSLQRQAGKLARVAINGNALDPKQHYRLATTRFLAQGGDGYPVLSTEVSYHDTRLLEAEALKAFILEQTPINPALFVPAPR